MSRKPLQNDCFQTAGKLMSHDEAIALLKSRIAPITGALELPLAEAAGRILAGPAIARQPVPAHTNAAVDGYAFAHASYDARDGTGFRVEGRAAAGHPLLSPLPPGSAVRIFTGAVMPEGLDTVAMQEDVTAVEEDGASRVTIPGGLKRGANVRLAGEDVEQGAELFAAGSVLRPQDLAALASIGLATVRCYERLRVAIVSSGDEIIRPGARALAPGEVYDANAPMLRALVALTGAEVSDLGIWPDSADEIQSRLSHASKSYDVILTSGGASRGEEDHMAAALDALGTRHLWQIAVKPGRPMMFGQIGEAVVVGLPGNPVAVFVCFLMYVYPILRRLGGAPWLEPRRIRLPAAFSFPKRKPGRRELWRGMIVETESGLAAGKFERDGSGLISGLRAADGLIDMPESVGPVAPGDLVSFIPFDQFGIAPR